MASFVIEYIDKKGNKKKIIKSSESKTAVLKELKNEGLLIVSIKETKESKKHKFPTFNPNRSKYVQDICYQLSVLLKSGIPLVEALKITANNLKREKYKKMLFDVASDVSEGKSFSSSLRKYEWFMDKVYINIISLSEKLGKLADALYDIALFEETKNITKDKIKSAMLYPITVFSIGLGVIGFLITFVVPKMEKIFSSMDKELPLSTKLLLQTSKFFKSYGFVIVVFLIICSLILNFIYKKNPKIKEAIDKKLFKLNFIKKSILVQFAETVAFQLKEGLPLVNALKNTANTSKNLYFANQIKKIAEKVNQGISLTKASKEIKLFPELFIASISTGEKSGNLAELLKKSAEYYKKDIEKITSRFITLIEPIFIGVIGAVVGFIVFSIMLPLFELNTFIH